MSKSRQSSQFSTTTDNNLTGCPNSDVYCYVVRTDWIQEYKWNGAFILGVLTKMSNQRGFCYMSNDEMARQSGVDTRTIERILKDLESDGAIYRNSYSIGRGSKREIVTKENGITYWNQVMNSPTRPDHVKKAFLDSFLTDFKPQAMKPHTPPKKPTVQNFPPKNPPDKSVGHPQNPPDKSVGSYPTDKSVGRYTNVYLKEKRNSVRANPPKDKPLNPQLTKYAAAFPLLFNAMKEHHFDEEKMTVGFAYYQANQEKIDAKDSPIGFVIQAVKKGWAQEKMTEEKTKEDAQKARKDKLLRRRRAANAFVAKWKEKIDGWYVAMDEFSVKCWARGQSMIVGFMDSNFEAVLRLMEIRCEQQWSS